MKKNLSNFMIKKLLLKEKFKRLDEDNEGSFFELLSKIFLEPEIQNVFRNEIGFSSGGFEILEAVEEKEHPTHTPPPKKIKMPSLTYTWTSNDGLSSGSSQSGEFYAIEEKVGFTSEQKQAVSKAHELSCKGYDHGLAFSSCNFATGVEMNIRIAK